MNNSPYKIRAVDAIEYADEIAELQDKTALWRAPFDNVEWWLTFFEDAPVAYCGLMPSTLGSGFAYLVRVGVLAAHRGNQLQARMMQVAERYARRNAFHTLVSDTTENPHSAHNFVKRRWEPFSPDWKWAYANSIYWRKKLNKATRKKRG